MKKLVKKISVFLGLVVILAFGNTAVVYGGDDIIAVYVPNIKQEKTYWCWNACGVAILGNKGEKVSQSKFSEVVKGNSTNNEDASMREVRKGLKHYGYSGSITGSLDSGTIASELKARRPILAGYDARGNGHMVVISGYDYLGDRIEVMDPDVGKKVSYTTSRFTSNSTWTWVESMKDIK